MSQNSVATTSTMIPPGAATVEDGVQRYEAEQRRRKRLLVFSRIALLAAILAIWEYGTGRWFDVLWFSSPSLIAANFIAWCQGDLFYHLGITLRETFLGYIGGTIAGVVLGTALFRFDFVGRLLDPFIVALNGIPRIALAPLFIIWFGIGETSKIVLAGLMTFFLCFYATLSGLRAVEKVHIDIARIMGASDLQTFFKVVLPAASPWIITAMKVSVPFSLIGSIVGEFMASTAGLGYKIQLYTSQFDTTGAVTGVFVLMLVVVGFNTVLDYVEAYLLRWRPKTSAGGRSEAQ